MKLRIAPGMVRRRRSTGGRSRGRLGMVSVRLNGLSRRFRWCLIWQSTQHSLPRPSSSGSGLPLGVARQRNAPSKMQWRLWPSQHFSSFFCQYARTRSALFKSCRCLPHRSGSAEWSRFREQPWKPKSVALRRCIIIVVARPSGAEKVEAEGVGPGRAPAAMAEADTRETLRVHALVSALQADRAAGRRRAFTSSRPD